MGFQLSNWAIFSVMKSICLIEEHFRDCVLERDVWFGKRLNAGVRWARFGWNNPFWYSLCNSGTSRCDWPTCKCKDDQLVSYQLRRVPDKWVCCVMTHTSGDFSPLWLNYSVLYVPVTCRDINSDPILWYLLIGCLMLASGNIIK